MSKFVKTLGLLALVGLIFGFAVTANAETLAASITAPATGTTVSIGQAVNLTGVATGGTGTYPSYKWVFSDGTASLIGATQSVTFATAGSKTIALTVTDSNGDKANANVTVTVTSGPQKPVISNIATSNITQTSVTITWTTDIPATSRVIYDSTSHPDISGATAPNFGYVASTAETDTETKVTSHSVTITGLNPGTKYYFRVLSQG